MEFTNEELKCYMIEYINNIIHNKIKIRCLSEDGNEIEANSSEKIETIVFDGYDENLFISFYGIHTSIFVYDEEIMFIDEQSKGTYTSSDVYNNVVFEGELRNMTHKGMLQMFADIIVCFIDATDVTVTQLEVTEGKYKSYNYYQPHDFHIYVYNKNLIKDKRVYKNITISWSESKK